MESNRRKQFEILMFAEIDRFPKKIFTRGNYGILRNILPACTIQGKWYGAYWHPWISNLALPIEELMQFLGGTLQSVDICGPDLIRLSKFHTNPIPSVQSDSSLFERCGCGLSLLLSVSPHH